MKKAILPLLPLLLFSCREEVAEKPDRLLKEQDMVNMLYDLSLLQSIDAYTPKTLEDNNIDAKTYIFNKYDIDSATFVQNQKYYISQLEKYEAIQKKVAERLKEDKVEFDSIVKAQDTVKPVKARTRKPDSLTDKKREMLKKLRPVKQ